MAYLNLASVRACTESEGPGKRFAIWVQGCSKRCQGCCNPEMQAFTQKTVVDTSDLIEIIAGSVRSDSIEGVTFLGGEPMLQAEGLSEVAEWARANNLSVIVFTGFLYEELEASEDKNLLRLLGNTDILVDGPYIEEQYDTERAWVGSKNQRVIFLSERYSDGIQNLNEARQMDILISDNDILINGWPYL